MFGKLRKRFTYANAAMTLALVFAMTGGAWAAGKFVITSTKQIKPSVLKQLQGKTGPAGPAGKDGAAGPAGKDGLNGTNGTNGKDGLPGGEGKEGPQGKEGKTGATGKEGPQGKEGAAGKEGVTGQEGSPWTDGGTLPSGKTETGAWSLEATASPESNTSDTMSFPIPLKAGIEEAHLKVVAESAKGAEGECSEGATRGTAESPKAAPGYFCLYVGKTVPANGEEFLKKSLEDSPKFLLKNPATLLGGTSTSGVRLLVQEVYVNEVASGTWAVTAP